MMQVWCLGFPLNHLPCDKESTWHYHIDPLGLYTISTPVDVEMTSEAPTPPLVVDDNDMVEALRVELAKCKSEHERESELVHMEHVNKVQGLRARIQELTILARVNNEQQGLPTGDVIEGVDGNSRARDICMNCFALRHHWIHTLNLDRFLDTVSK